ARKDLVALGHEGEAAGGLAVGFAVGDLLAVEGHLAADDACALGAEEAGHGPNRGCLAGTVWSEESDHLAGGDPERHVEDPERPVPVAHPQILGREDAFSHLADSPSGPF